MNTDVHKIIYNKLSECLSNNLKVHTIDKDNSMLELDYVTISNFIINGLKEFGYEIVRVDDGQKL